MVTLGLRAYSLPDLGSLKAIVRLMASLRFSCPSIWLALLRTPQSACVTGRSLAAVCGGLSVMHHFTHVPVFSGMYSNVLFGSRASQKK